MFPPPDPNEQLEMSATAGHRLPAPTAVYVMGAATPETDRIADRILDARPGVLFVVSQA
ncbi:MAG: hypothetical protein ACXVFK_16975 [Solirubrobacteraceae bacterium]